MTASDIDAARLEHWRQSARDLRIIKWAAATFGLAIVLGLIGIGEARQRLAHQAETLAETRRQLDRHDERIRMTERGADGVQATLRAQNERLTEILAEQRTTRQMIQQILTRHSP